MTWAEMTSLGLVQGQWTWTAETDGVIVKAGRKGCSDRTRGLVTPSHPVPGDGGA